jgi:hypothetical protein
MSENVGASTSGNPKGLHGLYRDNFTSAFIHTFQAMEAVQDYRLFEFCPSYGILKNTHAKEHNFSENGFCFRFRTRG